MATLRRHVAILGGLLLAGSPAQGQATPPTLQSDLVPPASIRLAWDAGEPNWILEGSDGSLDGWNTVLAAPALEGPDIALTTPLTTRSFFWRLRPQVTSGVAGARNFLRDSQGGLGLWSPDGGADILSSSGAMEALGMFASGEAAFDLTASLGLDALGSATARNHDELSRIIIALGKGGRSADAQIAQLLAGESPEITNAAAPGFPGGGWGAAPRFQDTLIDSALGLRALLAAGYPPGLCVVHQTVPIGLTSDPLAFDVPAGATLGALEIRESSGNAHFTVSYDDGSDDQYDAIPGFPVSIVLGNLPAGPASLTVTNNSGALLTFSAEVHFVIPGGQDVASVTTPATTLGLAQNPDGGWGVLPGSDSHLMVSYEVMKALAARKGGLENLLSAGAAWLATQQNPDGGFSSEADNSNVLETALAVLAIRLAPSPPDLSSAVAWLEGQQLLNGCWDEDPYVTALALRAIAKPPVIDPIPDQSVEIPAEFAIIPLDDYLSDPDNADGEISWEITGQSQLTVEIYDLSETSRTAYITYPPGTPVSETLTFTATDPDGLTTSTTATFTAAEPLVVDYTIARGNMVSDTRSFTTTTGNWDLTTAYVYVKTGLATGVTYNTTSFVKIAPDTFDVTFEIAVDGTAPLGVEDFSVEYNIRDAGSNTLLPVFDNVFDFSINITP